MEFNIDHDANTAAMSLLYVTHQLTHLEDTLSQSILSLLTKAPADPCKKAMPFLIPWVGIGVST